MRTGCWWENLKTDDHSEDLSVAMGIILKWILNEYHRKTWTGLIWLRIETSGGLL